MAVEDKVGLSDTLMTADNSEAKIKLDSGGIIELKENSLITFIKQASLGGGIYPQLDPASRKRNG